jgi:hypothetical protein
MGETLATLRFLGQGAKSMAISVVTKGRRLRGLVRHRGIGRHAAPRDASGPTPRRTPEYQGLHKASGPRLSGPYEKKVA